MMRRYCAGLCLLLCASGALAQSSPFDMAPERRNAPVPSVSVPLPGSSATPPIGVAPAAQPVAAKAAVSTTRYLVPSETLKLNGEIDERRWSIHLTPEQADSPAKLHLGYTNSIFVAPEASQLSVTINDVPIYADKIMAAETLSQRSLDVPAGVLKPGANVIGFSAKQRHRTDCTVESTYQLWSEINPGNTYLSFANPAATRMLRLDDIRALGVDDEGKSHVRMVAPGYEQRGTSTLMMRLAQALTLQSDMPNLSFHFEKQLKGEPRAGELPVIVGTFGELQSLRDKIPEIRNGIAMAGFISYPGSDNASALLVTGPDWASIGGLINGFLAKIDAAGTTPRETVSTRAWRPIDTPVVRNGETLTFAELGVRSQEFTGRLFRTDMTIGIPGDFYANAYGEATVLLDAAYSRDVLPGSQIDVFVNGNIASTEPITSAGGALLHQLPIKVTMRHFRPGVNTITIEASLLTRADEVCTPGSEASTTPRFALFNTSVLRLPEFARISQVPNLAATSGRAFPYRFATDTVPLFIGRPDIDTLSGAATFIGKMTQAAQRAFPIEVADIASRARSANALFFGPITEFPADILTRFNIDQNSSTVWNQPEGARNANGGAVNAESWRNRMGDDGLRSWLSRLDGWIEANFDLSVSSLRFLPSEDEIITPPQSASLMIVQEVSPMQDGVWTLVSGPDTRSLHGGMSQFSLRENWDMIDGRLTLYEGPIDGIRSLPINTVHFVATEPLSLGNIRLIVTNWLSDNTMSYALLLLILAIMLGFTTWLMLSRFGRSDE